MSKVNTATQLLGQTLRIPVVLPPIGSIQAFTEQGGSAVAEAAEEFGILQILSSSCAPDFETVAKRCLAHGSINFICLAIKLGSTIRSNARYCQWLHRFLFDRRYPGVFAP